MPISAARRRPGRTKPTSSSAAPAAMLPSFTTRSCRRLWPVASTERVFRSTPPRSSWLAFAAVAGSAPKRAEPPRSGHLRVELSRPLLSLEVAFRRADQMHDAGGVQDPEAVQVRRQLLDLVAAHYTGLGEVLRGRVGIGRDHLEPHLPLGQVRHPVDP